jgi:DNA polymerase-1
MKNHKPKAKSQKLVLLDAHAIIHRAYHALPDFATSKGEPTGALYGLSSMLLKLISDLRPDFIIACFDLPGPTHRHEAYEDYKSLRAKIDDELVVQLERSKEVFEAFGIPIYSHPGFEADDIIGTIVENKKRDKDIEIIIASGDMDTLQLVEGKKVKVFTLKKGISDTILYDEKKVVERFGFPPKLIADYKGLRGDPSDNIKGIPGIGDKTATTLITEFGSIEDIYKTLKKNPEKLKKTGLSDRIIKLLEEGEEDALFSKTLATIRTDAPVNFSLPKRWEESFEIGKALEFFDKLEFRTMGERAKMLLKNISSDDGGFNILIDKDQIPTNDQTQPILTKKEEKELCVALWVIDSNISNPTIEDVFRFAKTRDIDKVKKVIKSELKNREVEDIFEKIEKPIIRVVSEMNERGVKIDKVFLERLSKDYHKELSNLEKKIWQEAGEEFNINSPKILSQILFVKLGLLEKGQKKTPTGALSTKESELEKLKSRHPIISHILEYRELAKLLSTYIDAIPPLLDSNSRLHSTFLQEGTTTGRMASNNPNLQNIPNKTALGRAIRHAFIPEKNFKLLSLDYSQIELRLAAILSGDKKLIEIFKNGEDVHAGVASRIFKIPPEKVDKGMRIKAKTINFGILYGMGVNALKANLGTDRKEAQEFYNQYFETFIELADYLEKTKRQTERRGYTETMFGRRRYFSGFRSPLPYVRAQAERMAINAPIQGTQADIIKISMKKIADLILQNNWGKRAYLILQVHDELVYEVENSLVEKAALEFKKIMETVIPEKDLKGVPIVAEANVGENWGEMERLEAGSPPAGEAGKK